MKTKHLKPFLCLLLVAQNGEAREINMGTVPSTQIREYQQRWEDSRLWRSVRHYMDTAYQSERLEKIHARRGLFGPSILEAEVNYTPGGKSFVIDGRVS